LLCAEWQPQKIIAGPGRVTQKKKSELLVIVNASLRSGARIGLQRAAGIFSGVALRVEWAPQKINSQARHNHQEK
jgi:hypothetical protein